MASHNTKCLSPIKGRRIRVTRLDGCGRPVYGDDSQAVSKGFISVALTANTQDSDEINVTNAAGEICVYEAAETTLVGYGVEIQFCNVDPDLLALATGQEVYFDDNGDVIGFTVDTKIEQKGAFSLELWTGIAGGDACANPGADGDYGYLVLPWLYGGILGDFTVENGAVTFTLTGANTKDGHGWGVGPYDVVRSSLGAPQQLFTALTPSQALLVINTTVAPPEAVCGTRPLLDPDTEPLTAIAGVATGLSVAFTPTPDDIAAPVWYDFGDGTWDYLESADAGETTHVYDTAGTYTVKASSNGSVWVTTSVTVTGP